MYYLLPLTVIQIQGVDAENFLHGQITSNIKGMQDNSQTITAHCDAQGKVHSIFRIYRRNNQQFFALMPTKLQENFLTYLKKYAVFSKVEFQILDWQVLGSTNSDRQIEGGEFSFNLPDGRSITVTSQPIKEDLGEFGELKQWQLTSIQKGYPLINPKCLGEFIPQALNLDNLEEAMSFTKGCYLGQETIARAKFRGANKLKMLLLEGIGTIPEGKLDLGELDLEVQLGDNWRKTGTIISATQNGDKCLIQAVLNGQYSEEKFRCGEIALTPIATNKE